MARTTVLDTLDARTKEKLAEADTVERALNVLCYNLNWQVTKAEAASDLELAGKLRKILDAVSTASVLTAETEFHPVQPPPSSDYICAECFAPEPDCTC